MNSTESSLLCFIPSLFGRTPRGWNKSSCFFARRAKAYVGKLDLAKMACVLFVFCAVTAIVSPAQITTLLDFNGADGAYPGGNPSSPLGSMSLVQGTDGNFYGTTQYGGANGDGDGTVFEITPAGTLATLYSFCSETNCTDGEYPYAGLVQGTDGNFYGTTNSGGANNSGTVFRIEWVPALGLVYFTTLHSFCSASGCADGGGPEAPLVQGTDGNFYGTTQYGGATNYGTAFKITPAGVLTTVYSFCTYFNCSDGGGPSGLVQGTDGNFYGTTQYGGANGVCTYCGTVFKITPAGKLTTLYHFCSKTNCADGDGPFAGLVQAIDGNFYGTTALGGAGASECYFPPPPLGEGYYESCGTVFEITPAGVLTTLYSFCSASGCADGASPEAPLVQGTDGNFYGTTSFGGDSNCETYAGWTNGCGTVFLLFFGNLYSFEGSTDGSTPNGLVQGTDGNFYGTTNVAGNLSFCSVDTGNGCGTVFSLSEGLGPFVETRPTSGAEGAQIGILGQGFDSSSAVKFGGVQAKVVTATGTTFLTATVPAAALTGSVTVTTGSTTLTSNQEFRVTPKVKSFTPSDGPAGTVVTITGTGLKQTSKVTFGGVKASHTVVSDSEVTANVPAGAKTGKIAITTPGGTAKSSASFTVTE